MARSIKPRTPRPWITSGVSSIAKGGTGATDQESAVRNLGGIYTPRFDDALYIPKLTGEGKINKLHLPPSVSVGVMLIGPVVLFSTQVASYQISNFDSLSNYAIEVSDGVCVRRDDLITFTAPATAKTVKLTVNGRTIEITVRDPWPIKPTIAVSTSGTNSGAIGALTSSNFGMVAGDAGHLKTDWELATDSQFNDLVVSDRSDNVNIVSWNTTPLSLNKTYYARCRYYCVNGTVSDWSDGTAFTTKSRYTPSNEEAKLFASDKTANSNFGWNVDIDSTGTRVVVGAHLAANGVLVGSHGIFYVFRRSGTTWVQEMKSESGGLLGSSIYLGYSVSISDDGSRVAVGAPRAQNMLYTQCGAVYVYVRSGTTWTQETILYASDRASYDSFGTSVSISGNAERIVVGSPLADPNNVSAAGAVYVFSRIDTVWTQEVKLTAPVLVANDNFGNAVDITLAGIRIVVGAYLSDPSSVNAAGAAYVFKRTAKTWALEKTLIASDKRTGDQFGFSVSANQDGSRFAIGANLSTSTAGSVYIFSRDELTWCQEAKLIAFDKAAADQFGFSVCLNQEGDKLVAGSNLADPGGTSNAGAAYIFNRVGVIWVQETKITASDKEAADNYGCSVAISSDSSRIVVGSYLEDPSGTSNAGSLYVYS